MHGESRGLDEIYLRLERIERLITELTEKPVEITPVIAPDPFLVRLLSRLNVRQHAILQMLLRGASTSEISTRLGVSQSTTAGNIATLGRHFGVRGRAMIVAKGHEVLVAMASADYLAVSGGLPRDWDENYDSEPFDELLQRP